MKPMPYEIGQTISIRWAEFNFPHETFGQDGILAKIDHEQSEYHSPGAIYYIIFQNGHGYWASEQLMTPYRRDQNGTQ